MDLRLFLVGPVSGPGVVHLAPHKRGEGVDDSGPASVSGVREAAGFMFSARGRAIGFVDENVVVARGADDAVNGFIELLVPLLRGVFLAGLFASHCQ